MFAPPPSTARTRRLLALVMAAVFAGLFAPFTYLITMRVLDSPERTVISSTNVQHNKPADVMTFDKRMLRKLSMTHEKWIVCTGSEWTRAKIERITADYTGWAIILVDTSTFLSGNSLNTDNIIRLSAEKGVVFANPTVIDWAMEAFPGLFDTTQHADIPHHCDNRAHTGSDANIIRQINYSYLYAIAAGASVIFDVDDTHSAAQGGREILDACAVTLQQQQQQKSHHQANNESNIAYVDYNGPDSPVLNTWQLLGWNGWPRGFPLLYLNQAANNNSNNNNNDNTNTDSGRSSNSVLGKHRGGSEKQSASNHAANHGLAAVYFPAHGDADIDAVASLTPINDIISQNLHNPLQQVHILPPNTFMPLPKHTTLYGRDSFHALFLPVGVPLRVADSLRGYVLQASGWTGGRRVAVGPAVSRRAAPVFDAAKAWEQEARHMHWHGALKALQGLVASVQPTNGLPQLELQDVYSTLHQEGMTTESDIAAASMWQRAIHSLHAARGGSDLVPQGAFHRCVARERVFITGVTGMIGSHIARELARDPCVDIYGLVRPRSSMDGLGRLADKMTLLVGDIMDSPRMLDIIESLRPHYIYHLAAQAINSISYANPDLTLDSNVKGTLNILEAVKRFKINATVLLAGSSTEYGRTADIWEGPIPETAPLDPVTPYGVSKVATEMLGKQYFYAFGVRVIVARYFIQIGTGGTDSLAIQQFCRQIALAELGLQEATIYHGNLDTARDMTDARDSAAAVIQLARLGKPGEAYNVATGQAMSMKELLELAVSLSRVPVKLVQDFARFRPYDEKVLLGDATKLQRLTGWVPNRDLRPAIAEILQNWRLRMQSLHESGGPTEL